MHAIQYAAIGLVGCGIVFTSLIMWAEQYLPAHQRDGYQTPEQDAVPEEAAQVESLSVLTLVTQEVEPTEEQEEREELLAA